MWGGGVRTSALGSAGRVGADPSGAVVCMETPEAVASREAKGLAWVYGKGGQWGVRSGDLFMWENIRGKMEEEKVCDVCVEDSREEPLGGSWSWPNCQDEPREPRLAPERVVSPTVTRHKNWERATPHVWASNQLPLGGPRNKHLPPGNWRRLDSQQCGGFERTMQPREHTRQNPRPPKAPVIHVGWDCSSIALRFVERLGVGPVRGGILFRREPVGEKRSQKVLMACHPPLMKDVERSMTSRGPTPPPPAG